MSVAEPDDAPGSSGAHDAPGSSGAPLRVGVLASGDGTNLQALLDGVHGREAVVVAVAADKPTAGALQRARDAGIATAVFALADYPDRAARDGAIADWLLGHDVQLVVLAGYMALLTSPFLSRFPDAIVNVHPSLLPAFPGVRAIEQAIDYGVKIFGVTIHLVLDDGGVDTGPVIVQGAVELPGAVDPRAVHEALRPVEHALLPEAVRLIARGAVSRDPGNPRRIVVAPER
ncbi:MAG: phosphoribosylglycinamide formyltransferase [Solirubrobacteraceae bacterium]|nr:phosphoribosylglycinamide formyltransferase [Solirubrobacteraceae bacterium]